MEIVLYHNYYEFHFWSGLKPARLAEFLNMLPVGFQFVETPDGLFLDTRRGPGIFLLNRKSTPQEETPLPSEKANYYLRWNAGRAGELNLPRLARKLTRELCLEMETQVWLVDGYGRVLNQVGRDSFPSERSA